MIFQISDKKEFDVSADRLFDELSDLHRFIKIIPDVKEIKTISADKAHIVVTPGLSFLKGALDTQIELRIGVMEAKINVASKGIGSSSKMEADFKVEAVGEKSNLIWTVSVTEVGGLLKLVPTSLLKGAATKITGDLLVALNGIVNG